LVYFNGHRIEDKKMKKELSRHVAASHAYTRGVKFLPLLRHHCYSQFKGSSLGECPERVFVCTPASTELRSIRLDNLPWFQYQEALAPTCRSDNICEYSEMLTKTLVALELDRAYSLLSKRPNSPLGALSPSLPSFGLGIEENLETSG
jgi:hypothetical protein